jgi:hypothetical protein
MNRIILVVGALLTLVVTCAGCSTINSDGSVTAAHPLLGTKELQLTAGYALPPEAIAAGIILIIVMDPLAPNWKIEQSEPQPGVFHLAMKKKAIANDGGGDGEARVVFMRRASALAKEHGILPDQDSPGYSVLEFNEGVESNFPFARRVAYGVVKVGDRR